MTTNFVLRCAGSADAPGLSRLMTETFLAAYGHVAPPDSLERHIARNYAADLIGNRIDQGEIEVWVLDAENGGGPNTDAGYLQLGLKVAPPPQLAGRATVEVQRCYMRPDYIGAGGAGLLMQQAQQRTRDLTASALHLSVYQLAPRAVRFYEKHGFRRAAPLKYYIDDVEFDDWLMVWEA